MVLLIIKWTGINFIKSGIYQICLHLYNISEVQISYGEYLKMILREFPLFLRKNTCCNFFIKIHVVIVSPISFVTPHEQHLIEMVLIRGHNICFHGEMKKITVIPVLKSHQRET